MQIAASNSAFSKEAASLAAADFRVGDLRKEAANEAIWDTGENGGIEIIEKSEKKTEGILDKINSFISSHAQKGYRLASVAHVLNGLTEIEDFLPSGLKDFIDKNVMRLNKMVNGIVYTNIGLQALKSKDSFDAIARFLDPIFATTSTLYNYHMFRGWSSALTMIDDANKKNIIKKPNQSLLDNLKANLKETFRQTKEIFDEGIPELFRKLWKSETERDNNHIKSFSGHLMIIGPLIKMLFSRKNHDFGDKLAGLIRNTGGIISDLGMIRNSQGESKKAGKFYIFHAIFDAAKRFFSEETAKIIDSFIMPLYNEALYYFGVMSRSGRDHQVAEVH